MSGYYAAGGEWLPELDIDAFAAAPDYPVRIELRPGELNRLAVLLRICLATPAGIVYAVLDAGWAACSFFIWLIVLLMGRMPEPLFEATAAIARYQMRFYAYWLMLTPAYPKRLFGDGTRTEGPAGEVAAPRRTSATRPFLMTAAGRVVLVVFIVIGIFSAVGGGAGGEASDQNQGTSAGLAPAGQH